MRTPRSDLAHAAIPVGAIGLARPLPAAPAGATVQRRARWRWSYPAATGSRDLRIDFLRGLAILFVIVDHINFPSIYHVISHQRIGSVSGAELFVVLSGVVLGMVYRRRAAEEGLHPVARKIWSRARLLYLTSLLVLMVAYALSFAPVLDTRVLTTFTDQATGTVYSLYPTTPLLADYPVPPSAVRDLLLLNVGPFQFNVMGLYVVLLLLAPIALRLLLANRWWILLGISWALYLVNDQLRLRVFPSQFEYPFPLLSWQILFFHGLLVGFYWKAVIAWFDRPLGRLLILISFGLYLTFLLFAWNNPALSNDPFSLQLQWIPSDEFLRIYSAYFEREYLGIMRVANVAVLIVTAYAMLSRFWVPFYRLFGWLLVPLGGATLYVFILHVFFALLAANIPALETGNVWINTFAHTVILLALWLMVKQEFLFRWIPR